MFPLIPALILLLLHGPANFEKLAETGRLPASLAVFQREAAHGPQEAEAARQDVSRRALATLIAASGNRELTQAFASMFVDALPAPAAPEEARPVTCEPAVVFFDEGPPPVSEGFSRFVRSRDGPAIA